MITESDSFSTYDLGKYYVILPQVTNWNLQEYIKEFKAKKVAEGFQFNSGKNTEWVNAADIQELIKKHIDPDFKA